MNTLAVVAGLAAAVAAGLRWLRVAQREHYLAGSVSRFAVRWWGSGPNLLLALAVVLGVALSPAAPLSAVAGNGALAIGPFGLALRGRTSRLAWTQRLRRLAAVSAALYVAVLGAGVLAGFGPTVAALAAALTPLLVDAALAITGPVERRLAQPWVAAATIRLSQVAPTVVAITGSYGKTTTKGYVAHLVGGSRSVVPSPASFNNRAGLARAVNEHLTPGTEVFVAEMGTYGKGEIAELCGWCQPEVAVICAIGPVHLERMGTEDAIAEAKAEILDGARVAVLNVDHPLLERLAVRREQAGQRVVRCSARPMDPPADVAVVEGEVRLAGRRLGTVPKTLGAAPTNVACAVAAALEVGVTEDAVAERLASLPTAPHRLSVSIGTTGATIFDDTYNANPAGAAAALDALARHGTAEHRRVVVTPGMVELGPVQREENCRFAAAAAAIATHVVVVGHTNRAALVAGASEGRAEVVLVETRDQAVAWVREHVGPGDAVLYENDLPDHFP